MTEQHSITAQDVTQWLKDNPDYLSQNPQILNYIAPPNSVEETQTVVDFQKLMVKKLQKDHAEALETTNMLVEHTRSNLDNQNRIHAAVLNLLDATSFEEFIHIITADLSLTLDVDVVSIAIENDGNDVPHQYLAGVRLLKKGDVHKIMPGKNHMLFSETRGDEYIFGEASGLVHSQCLLRLGIHPKVPEGILSFGSRDPHFFSPDQGIDQVAFLARVIERCIRAWLNLPS